MGDFVPFLADLAEDAVDADAGEQVFDVLVDVGESLGFFFFIRVGLMPLREALLILGGVTGEAFEPFFAFIEDFVMFDVFEEQIEKLWHFQYAGL